MSLHPKRGLKLCQDTAILKADFIERVFPFVAAELDNRFALHYLNAVGGGIHLQHLEHCGSDDYDRFIHFSWLSDWDAEVLSPPQVLGGIHSISFSGIPGKSWSAGDVERVNIALVHALQWDVLQSKGMKHAKPYYQPPDNCAFETVFSPGGLEGTDTDNMTVRIRRLRRPISVLPVQGNHNARGSLGPGPC